MAYKFRSRNPETGEMELYEDAGRSIPVDFGGMNLTGMPNLDYLQNLANLVQQQQGPQLGPDEFGSYSIPMSDPTYRSGFDYARSIAGGIPMSQVIAPGVSYSPEQPMGYTQEQLNTPVGTTPVETPTYQEPDDPSFLGTGIGGVNIPLYKDKMPPLRDIFGGFQKPDLRPDIQPITPPIQTPPTIDIDAIRQQIAESGIDFGNLLGIPKIEQPDLSQFVRREDIPTLIPDVPTGRDFSVDREALIRDIREGIEIPKYEMPDLSQFARLEDIPTVPTFDREALIRDIRSGIDIPKPPSIDRQALIEDIRSGIELPTYQTPDLSGFARLEDIPQIPTFDPRDYREDFLSIAREGIDIPQYEAPDLSGFARLEDIPTFDPSSLQQQISGLQQQFGSITPFDASALQQQIAANQAAIAGINIPTYQAPNLSAYDARIAELEQQLAGLQTPTGGRFSVDQQLPRGLF